ncbi:MAG TPA: hypothetical protein VK607_12330 [Kofleriaceae bacterium]|nr:hypothetical protein [Kofleriaceae bacterium]
MVHRPRSYFPVLYPLIPWVAVMAAGYAFGPLLGGEPAARNRRLIILGVAVALGFVVLRDINGYGDEPRQASPHAVLSFLNTAKYPPSLLFLLMTLGPAIAILPVLDRLAPTRLGRFLTTFGRVPLFFYFVHIYAAHGLALVAALALTGHVKGDVFDLWVVYVLWAILIAALYPLCRWFAGVKARRRDWWLSYL